MSEDKGYPASFALPPRRVVFGGPMAAQPSPPRKVVEPSAPPAWLDAMPDEVNEAMAQWQR